MKRSLLVAGLVVAMASVANAAQVHIFLAAGGATNGATDCLSAANAGVNPELPAGPGASTLFVCMQLNSAQLAGAGAFGGNIDIDSTVGLNGGPGALVVNNPSSRWGSPTNGTAGAGPDAYSGMLLNAAVAVTAASPSDAANGNGPIFLIASGSINYGAGGAAWINLPANGAFGGNDPAGALGGAFGWAAPGVPDIGGIGSDINGTPGVQASYADLGAGDPSYGFILSDLGGTGVRTGLADLTVLPEPATLALLGLGGLLIRRKR